MKIKNLSTDQVQIIFTDSELYLLNNVLNEACFGMLTDRFVLSQEEVREMLNHIHEGLTGLVPKTKARARAYFEYLQ